MARVVRVGLALVLGSAVGLSSGCDSTPKAAAPEDRKENVQQTSFDEVKQMLELRKGDAPGKSITKVADFAKYEKLLPNGLYKLKSGEIVFLFGAPVQEGGTDTILAYEKQAPESGGYVLMQDGTTVKKLTAEEFKAAKKAPGTPQTPSKK